MIYIILKSLLYVGFPIILGGFIYRYFGGKCTSSNRIDGKTVIVTGGTAGIGKETAKDLALRGGRIIIACRNLSKGKKTKEWIESSGKKVTVLCKELDTSDLDSVRRFANDIKQSESRLDILINNAGTVVPDQRESAQGYELTYATNHLGHFLLTNMLLNMMKKSEKGRIINVSSLAHWYFHLDLRDIHFKKRSFSPWFSYCQSKLANVLFTNELARRLKNTGVTVNSLHPGAVSTELPIKENTVLGYFVSFGLSLVGKTSKQGAQTSIFLAIADEVENISGEYFVDCKVASTSIETKSTRLAEDLWTLSEKETNLQEADLK